MQNLRGHYPGGDLESEMIFRSAYLMHWGISIVVLQEIYQKIRDSLSPSLEAGVGKAFTCADPESVKNTGFQRVLPLREDIAMRWASAVVEGEITEELYRTALGAFIPEALSDLTLTVVLIEGIIKADLSKTGS